MMKCRIGMETIPDCGQTICCCECEKKATCQDCCSNCEDAECDERFEFNEDTALQTFLQDEKAIAVMKQIAETKLQKETLEAKDKEIRQKLTSMMDAYGIKSFDNNILKVTFIAETTSTSIDTAKLKKEEPEIAKKYAKTSKKSAYVRIDVK